MLSKVGVLAERSMEKSKKHHAGASPESASTVKNNKFARFGTHPAQPPDPADPPDLADQVSSTAARNLPSTRAGGQDDVS